MMGGALVLLAGALVPAIMGEEDAPAWVSNATLVVGYGFLAYGFLLAMRARKGPGKSWTGDTKDGWSPPEEGDS